MLKYKKNELSEDGEWFKLIAAGNTKTFKKYLNNRKCEFFITSDDDKVRHLEGRIYIDEGDIYPTQEDKIIEGLGLRPRLEYILIVLGNGDTHNNLDILYALLHNYQLTCKDLSSKIVSTLESGAVNIRKYSCFYEIRSKWNSILKELSLAFDTKLDLFIVEQDEWRQYSYWDVFTDIKNPKNSIVEYFKPCLMQGPSKEIKFEVDNCSKQIELFKIKTTAAILPEVTTFDLVIDYINSIYLEYRHQLELVEAIKLNDVKIWIFKISYGHLLISNSLPSVVHSENSYNTISPRELAVQVYTFGVDYKSRFSYSKGNDNWILTSALYSE